MSKMRILYTKSVSRWGKIPVTIALTLAMLVVVTAVALALDLRGAGSSGIINSAYFEVFTPTDPTGSGNFYSFVRLGGGEVIKGYNTSYRPLEFDENSSSTFTRDILLSDVPTFTENGVLYREFQLDINQTNSNPYITLGKLQIFLTDIKGITGYPFTGKATLIYDMDELKDEFVDLDYSNNTGSGKRDLKVLIPDSLFGNDPACAFLGTDCKTYVVLFSEFGQPNYVNNDGYEEWGVAVYNTVSGSKWHDLDADGIWDAGEPGLAGWQICAQPLVNGLPVGEPVCTTTKADGSYALGVPDGTYEVKETCPANWFQSYPTPTGACGTGIYTVTVDRGEALTGQDFGNYQTVSVKACKLEDVDKNPTTTADRINVASWDVYLSINGVRQTPGAKTGSDGCYTWANLTPGPSYDVEEDVPTGWFAWTETKHNFGPSTSGGSFSYTFINSKTVSVKACKLEDKNADPALNPDGDRVPVKDWTVKLTKNGVVQDTKTTGADGCYTWTNLEPLAAPNYYDVHEVVPADWYNWTPTSVNCTAGVNGGACDATFVNSKRVKVTACKLEDKNADPASNPDGDRVPVPDWPVYLSIDGVRQTPGAKTGADGCYTWEKLQPGLVYDVEEDVLAGWKAWTPTKYNFGASVSGGEYKYTFINSKTVEVTACKVEDTDANPATDTDRKAVPGWDVFLSIAGVRQTPGAKTGADGCYTWKNLDPGIKYDVEEDVPADWYAWTPTKYDFGASVSGGKYSYTFINSKRVEVTACKVEDKNADPAVNPDGDRVPVKDWNVYLSIAGVRQTPGAKTDDKGCYTWKNLDPGIKYDVEEDVPADWYAWTPTKYDFGASVSGGKYSYTFINSKKVTVKICKFEDKNADPALNPEGDRVPVKGWSVYLTKDGVIQGDAKLTGDDGCATWTMLNPLAPPSKYDAHEVVPADWYAWTKTDIDCEHIASGGTCTVNFVNSMRVKVTACKLWDKDGKLDTPADQVVLSKWPVYLSIAGVRQLPGAETGADGCYTWDLLQPGLTYDVEEDVLTGWKALTETKHNFGPSVSGGVYKYTFINYKPLGCTYTLGYWKTHSMYGPAGPYDPSWDLKLGGDEPFLDAIWNTGFTWYTILVEPPAKGNAYLILAHQYVAAWLNANNVDPDKKADTSELGTALEDAKYLLGNYTPAYDFKADPDGVRDDFIMLAGILGEFNEGMLGPKHCE
jgi:hypothetical protein